MRCAVNAGLDPDEGTVHGEWIDALRRDAIELVVVPDSGSRSTRLLEFREIEGVLLVDDPDPERTGVRDARDPAFHRTGRELVRFARARRIPLVGIGHWAEFLGLYFGGRLRSQPDRQPGDRHTDLHVAPGYGPPRASVHPVGRMHCDPKDFPPELTPIAWDEQGNIAGFVHRDEPILGIHWQPDGAANPVTEFLMGRTRQPAGGPEMNLRTG